MGLHTCFCALCGAGFEYRSHELPYELRPERYVGGSTTIEEGEEGHYESHVLDSNVMSDEKLKWLEVLRMVSLNTDRPGRQGFVSGLGRFEDNDLEVDRGFDPNAPKGNCKVAYFDYDDYSSVSGMGFLEVALDMNFWESAFHDACLKVFIYALKIKKGLSTKDSIDIDWTRFHSSMNVKQEEPRPPNCLSGYRGFQDIPPFYEMNEIAGQQHFAYRHGLEPYLADPLRTGNLRSPEIWGHLFNLSQRKLTQPPARSHAPQSEEETMKWFKRIKSDLPWMWELHEMVHFAKVADWREIYARAHELSFLKEWNRYRWYEHNAGRKPGPGLYNDAQGRLVPIAAEEIQDYTYVMPELLGFASRRRIWQCVQPIVDKYIEMEAKDNKDDSSEEEDDDEEDDSSEDEDEDDDEDEDEDKEEKGKGKDGDGDDMMSQDTI